MKFLRRFICLFYCLCLVGCLSSCNGIFSENGGGSSTSTEDALKLNDTRRCTNSSIKFMDKSQSSSVTYYITPTGFELNRLSEQGYTMRISVSYEVYYKKDYNVLWDIGYAGSPKYEIYLLNDDGLGSIQENLTTKKQKADRTISYISTATDLLNTKITLTFSTDNIQNIIYFENIVVSYTCYK